MGDTEVRPKEKKYSSKYIAVFYNEKYSRWVAQRWSNNVNKVVYNGCYKDEETAAHASDTLARKLTENGEQNFKLNFPDDNTEVNKKTALSKFIGVSYNESHSRWIAQRRSKKEKKPVYNGCYKDEETAARASDTLARKLTENGEQNHKLNFPGDYTEIYTENQKNKRMKLRTSSKQISFLHSNSGQQ